MELTRLAANGHLERVARGIYRASGAPSVHDEAVWVAWRSLDPSAPAWSRDLCSCAASHNTAAWLLGLGELNPEPLTFTSPIRRQVSREGLRIVHGPLLVGNVRLVEGLPGTTAARTVCDLARDGEDLSLVALVLEDALSEGAVRDARALKARVDELCAGRDVPKGTSLYGMPRG